MVFGNKINIKVTFIYRYHYNKIYSLCSMTSSIFKTLDSDESSLQRRN